MRYYVRKEVMVSFNYFNTEEDLEKLMSVITATL